MLQPSRTSVTRSTSLSTRWYEPFSSHSAMPSALRCAREKVLVALVLMSALPLTYLLVR